MEDVSPTLILIWDVRRFLEKGQSLSAAIKFFLARKITNKFLSQVELWWVSQNNSLFAFDKTELPASRRYLLEILENGLRGQSILEILKAYEIEIIQSCEDEIQSHLAKLPLLLMFPLMGLIFPALMLLLLGPLLGSLQF